MSEEPLYVRQEVRGRSVCLVGAVSMNPSVFKVNGLDYSFFKEGEGTASGPEPSTHNPFG